jgi:TP901 family phage tail tape measure protein
MWGDIETMVAQARGSGRLGARRGHERDAVCRGWKTDAGSAFQSFVEGLGKGNERGKSAIASLAELGVTEQRTTRAVLGLATAGDLLARSLATSEEAWNENTALAKEAGTRYGTTASQIQMAENAVNNLNIAVGDKFKPLVTDYAMAGKEMAQVAGRSRIRPQDADYDESRA